MKVGFIGTGNIAQSHLKAVAQVPEAQIVGICDVAPGRAEEVTKTYGGKAYTDYRDMLAKEDLNAVFVAVPTFARGNMEEDIAAAGIHMLVEKPLGLSMDLVLRKQEAIAKAGIINSVGYCVRYQGIMDRVREWVADGLNPVVAEAHYWTASSLRGWYMDEDKSGGQLIDQTTHVIDLLRYVLGDVEEVYAYLGTYAKPDIQGWNVPTTGSLALKFKSGVVGTVTQSNVAGIFEAGINLIGTGGAIHYTYGEAKLTKGRTSTVIERASGDMYLAQDKAFLQAVATKDQSLVRCSYADAAKTLALTLAAQQSAREGRPVKL